MIFYLSSTSTNTSTLSQVQVQIHCVINQNTQINIQSYVTLPLSLILRLYNIKPLKVKVLGY